MQWLFTCTQLPRAACCRYKTTQEEDGAVIDDPAAGPRQKVAARLLRIEKSILGGAHLTNERTIDHGCRQRLSKVHPRPVDC